MTTTACGVIVWRGDSYGRLKPHQPGAADVSKVFVFLLTGFVKSMVTSRSVSPISVAQPRPRNQEKRPRQARKVSSSVPETWNLLFISLPFPTATCNRHLLITHLSIPDFLTLPSPLSFLLVCRIFAPGDIIIHVPFIEGEKRKRKRKRLSG